jgi:phenylalanyl-tRNA synthetase beta chain
MKFSLNWLREFVDTDKLDPQIVGESLTLHTCELEEVILVSKNFDHVFAAKLIDVKPHPQAEKLHIGTFDCGKQGKKQIIFGEVFPLAKGEIYPVALDGARLASGIEIKNSEIRGVKSEGMVCTCQELGMKQEALLKFESENIGKSLPEIVPEFGDILFDIDNKSLTHRPDLMGHRGMAREIGAIWDKEFESNIFAPEITAGKPFPVKIETEKCHRFCAVKIKNVTVEPSDISTQARLENVGIRAISNLVDLTNLSLAGFGQPMHVFDADKLEGGITIRFAKKGEKILALDGEEYELQTEDIVVADDKKVLSIAGVMGEMGSSVTNTTKNIVFESANFDATSIRHTSARLGLRSESSMRYEKSLDPEQCLETILWATGKTQQLCEKAQLASSVGDAYPQTTEELFIDLNPSLVRKLSGIEISNKEIIASLESLGFEVWTEEAAEIFVVKVPSWRATKDISIAEDLVEEVVRLQGFDAVPSILPTLSITPPRRNPVRELEWSIRDFLMNTNRNEIYLTSFVGPQDNKWLEKETHVTVQNGANEEYEKLRLTLISNTVRGMESELRTYGKLNLFEIGTVFPAIGKESRNLLLFSAEMGKTATKKFFEQKSELLSLLSALGVKGEIRKCTTPQAIFHPTQCADIFVNNAFLGNISVLHPAKTPVRGATVVFSEIDIHELSHILLQQELKYVSLSHFPPVRRDISVVVSQNTQQSDIEEIMKKASPFLTAVELFDVFMDEEKLGKENKNLAFHLTFQASDKTLDEASIDTAMKSIFEAIEKNFQATLRLAFDQKKS